MAILCKARRLLKASTLITLYYKISNLFKYPYFTYCIEVWGHTCDKYMSSLFKVQKRAVRIITYSYNVFLKLLTAIIFIIYYYHVLIFMLKHKKGLLPPIFNDMFIQNNTIHSHNTRQANNIYVSDFKNRSSQQTIKFTRTKLWNFMYYKLKTNINLSSHRLKEYIVANGFPIINYIQKCS